ncbi:hypothetical protein B0H15DRAFT_858794 [Mycena belliarum]|uniref:Uncharacterized protein n=1 Tax=Mycena belliarum TaxID=1033014 RepID=A0AAD6TTM1_9AGAR|nr:hypothetical protein B0H15DRAFT_858794 [Mycena belliae]
MYRVRLRPFSANALVLHWSLDVLIGCFPTLNCGSAPALAQNWAPPSKSLSASQNSQVIKRSLLQYSSSKGLETAQAGLSLWSQGVSGPIGQSFRTQRPYH